MTQPTKEQWKELAVNLDKMFSDIYLLCDGYYLLYRMERSKNKLVICVYVNGFMKGEWFGIDDEASEEARRFWRPSIKARYSAKYIKLCEKLYGKRECKKKGIYDKRTIYYPYWNRPNPIISHLKKTCENIEILDRETYKSGLDKHHAESKQTN